MLKQRIITAIVLLSVLVLVMSTSSPWPFACMMAILCGCAGWEWGRMTWPGHPAVSILFGSSLFAFTLAISHKLFLMGDVHAPWFEWLVVIAALVWLSAVPVAVLRGHADAPARDLGWTLFAPIALLAACILMIFLFYLRGTMYLLSLLMLIWIADIFAYFGGKRFGKHKLAFRISPGKTVEGALTGLLGVLAWIAISSQWKDTFAADLLARWGWALTLLAAVVLGCISVMGDLFESLLKRRAGIKDSSALLPGHGGVLDRIDAVIAVLPVAYLMTTWPMS